MQCEQSGCKKVEQKDDYRTATIGSLGLRLGGRKREGFDLHGIDCSHIVQEDLNFGLLPGLGFLNRALQQM